MKLLRSDWKTERCLVAPAHDGDLAGMASVFSENAEVLRLLGDDCAPERLASDLLHHQALPPNGDPNREFACLIVDRESSETIGLLGIYCGYPKDTTFYIGSLFFKQRWQRCGLGREVVTSLELHALEHGYDEARVNVGLKNWPALCFWVGLDYNRVTRITGDRAFADATFANIELTKRLVREEPKP